MHVMIRFSHSSLIAFAALMLAATPLHAVSLPSSPGVLEEDGARFERRAQSTFVWKSLLKVYDIALDLGAGQRHFDPIADVPMRLELRYHRSIKAADIIKGGDALLRRNVTAATLALLRPRVEELNRAYVNVGPGDAYTLTYVPGRGTTLRLNGTALATIPGHDFATAYFRIWLGPQPMCGKVRDALLGIPSDS